VLVSDRVGCAVDLVAESCGRIFPWADPLALLRVLNEMLEDRNKLSEMGRQAAIRARSFDIARTEAALISWLVRE
jgi:hypothetical protein